MKKSFSLIMVAILLTTMLAGCTNTSTVKETKNVKIGVIAPLSGPAANYGEDAANAYNFIADKFNAENSGKIHAELVIEDGKCDGKDAASAMQKLINVDQVQVVMSEVCSSAAIPADKIAQANKIVAISPVASSPDVANIGPYVYRFYNDANSTKGISNYLDAHNVKNIAILFENTDYGLGYEKGIRANFKGTIGFEEGFASNEKDFNMIAKKLKNDSTNIDALIVIGNSDATNVPMFKALNENGLLKQFKGKIYGTEVTATDAILASIGNLLEGVKVTEIVLVKDMGNKANQFLDDFKAQHKVVSSEFAVNLFAEAMSLSLDAIKHNGNTADGIRAYFDSYSANNLRDGYFGKYYFGSERDAIGLNFVIYEVKNGQKIAVE